MTSGLENIAYKEYLGRLIIIGRNRGGNNDIIVYAVTGRSESSRARILIEYDDGTIGTDVTDTEQLEKGNHKLLIYNCIRRFHDQFIVSNGAQTDVIFNVMEELRAKDVCKTPIGILVAAFERPYLVRGAKKEELIDLTCYEPDAPTFTPRISGVLTREGAAMSITRWAEGSAIRSFFEIPLLNGKGRALATYEGENVPTGHKLPSFKGEPLDVDLDGTTPEDVTNDVYQALAPKVPGKDFRVGVATVFYERAFNKMSNSIINKNEKGK